MQIVLVDTHEFSKPELDEMWRLIERFGLKRQMLEDRLEPRQVLELYMSIKGRGLKDRETA